MLFELKSNDPAEISKGIDRVGEYAQFANQTKFLGRDDWVGKVVVYDKEKAAGFDTLLHED